MNLDQHADTALVAHAVLSAFAGLVANLDRSGKLDQLTLDHARRPLETLLDQLRTEETTNFLQDCLALMPSEPRQRAPDISRDTAPGSTFDID